MQSIGVVLSTEKEKNAAGRDFSSFSLQHSCIQIRELKYKQINQPPNSSELSKLSEVLIRNHDGVWMTLGHQSGPKFIYCHQCVMISDPCSCFLSCFSQFRHPYSWSSCLDPGVMVSREGRYLFGWHGLKYITHLKRYILALYAFTGKIQSKLSSKKWNWHFYAWICILFFLKEGLYIMYNHI